MVHKPEWFKNDQVFVSYARTVGINKDGNTLFTVEASTGKRTGEIDNKVALDIDALFEGGSTDTSRWIDSANFGYAVPTYYDDRYTAALEELLRTPAFDGFEARSLASLIKDKLITRQPGHGSPSQDLRGGTVPYIKVSDIRAGQVNINPSTLVPEPVAERFWRGKESRIKPFDLITPIRASNNIGEFAIIMPGQERMVLTKEVLILRAAEDAPVDNFYLLWALTLKVVRDQWKRVVFMQTNRDDVGDRYLELQIPWPTSKDAAEKISAEFREYYQGLDKLRTRFVSKLEDGGLHHVFLGDGALPEEADGPGSD
ncbi:hypothetical protein LC082_13855 [Microbacterium esteraromaticum]|uniref:hypothetical protein n=1 Tax=Microbacterium esteraromaticum TaxID=57043 RepID=UPI001CD5C5F1|nr:hypothetical protein [Microbacterium esteraromaticum]MCA1307982.1 hypothetical protein [Microbacterium esteraromaticum]